MKVFGIGLSKTGTTSLADGLELLGVRTKSFPTLTEHYENFAGAVDTPVAASFKELDRIYPGSRFIYTIRERSSWLRSCESMWKRRHEYFSRVPFVAHLHQKLYGTLLYDEKKFSLAYDRHDLLIQDYFSSRPGDLLTIDLIGGAPRWAPLCKFLSFDVPSAPFPHTNESEQVLALIRHVAIVLNDIKAILAIAGVNEKVLTEILCKSNLPKMKLNLGRDWETRLIIRNAIEWFGDADKAGLALKLCPCEISRIVGSE